MPHFSRTSDQRLDTAHVDLQDLFREVVKYFDCKVLYGHRNPETQFELFQRGRELRNGLWVVVNEIEVVTNCDGYEKISDHNYLPSRAVDVAPYYPAKPHIRWKDTARFYYFAGFVRCMALGMNIPIQCGADWDDDTEVKDQTLMDLPHYGLILPETALKAA